MWNFFFPIYPVSTHHFEWLGALVTGPAAMGGEAALRGLWSRAYGNDSQEQLTVAARYGGYYDKECWEAVGE